MIQRMGTGSGEKVERLSGDVHWMGLGHAPCADPSGGGGRVGCWWNGRAVN